MKFKRRQISKTTRELVIARDESTCRYCGERLLRALVTMDHVIPVSKGGSNEADNLVVACVDCNGRKGSTLLPVAGEVPTVIVLGDCSATGWSGMVKCPLDAGHAGRHRF